MDQHETSKTYQKGKHRLVIFGLCVDIAVLFLFFNTGLSFQARDVAGQFTAQPFLVNSLYIIMLATGMFLISFPTALYSGYLREHKFGLSTQNFSKWLVDHLKKSLIGFVILIILIGVMYTLLSRYPHNWWMGAGCFWILLSFVLAKLTPNYIIPLFFKYSPLKNQSLRENIHALFRACEVKLKDVYAINFSSKTKKANAFLCGIGKNRKVVLSDTLIENFTNSEIEVVVAHELGHYKHWDILKLLAANSVVIFGGLYAANLFLLRILAGYPEGRIDDIGFFPVVALSSIAFSFIATPFVNGYSRMIERQADQFSLKTTNKPNDFISVMEKLAKINLAEHNPSKIIEFFFYDHPTISQRIKFAQSFKP